MLTSDRLRRLAASIPLALLCFAAPVREVAARSQEANLIPVVALGTSTVTDKPSAVRGDMLLANDGNIYFVSSSGGKGFGAISKLAPDGTLSVLYAFANRDEGASSFAPLIQASDGHLYGTTYLGGTDGLGVAFRVTLAGVYTTLKSFTSTGNEAILPYTGLVQASDGNLYGTTLRGGTNDKGTVFRLGLDGTYSIVHHFSGNDGEFPEGTLIIGTDGNMYGTTLQGGSANRGTIYRIGTNGTLTSVFSFPALGAFNTDGLAVNALGANPRSALKLGSDGNYYGTAFQGGANGWGSVYRMTPAGTVTAVHSFAGPSAGGGFPLASVIQDAAGNLYGTSQQGGFLNLGAVWRIDAVGQFSLLHGFANSISDGSAPYAGLLLANNSIYGVSYSDSFTNSGSIFKIDVGSNGVLPVEFSLSATDISLSSTSTLTWSSATATACTAIGAWDGTTVAAAGTLAVTPTAAGIYTYGLSCTDGAGVVRIAYAALTVRAPALQPVDGGAGGSGSLSIAALLLLAALLSWKLFKERVSACP